MSQCGCEPVHFTVQYNLEPNLSWLIKQTKASCNPACCISSTSKSPQHKTASSFGWIHYPDVCCAAHSPHADRCSHSSHKIWINPRQNLPLCCYVLYVTAQLGYTFRLTTDRDCVTSIRLHSENNCKRVMSISTISWYCFIHLILCKALVSQMYEGYLHLVSLLLLLDGV